MLSKPKLLVIHGKGGCDFWRTWQPCEEMRKQGLAEVRYIEARDIDVKLLSENFKWCDLAVIRGLIGMEGLATLRRYQQLGVKIATDYDDLHFNVSPFNPAYKHFGVDEVEVKDPTTGDIKKLWQDGRDGFDLKANQMKFHSYVSVLQEADLITTTTPYLKQAMAELSGRIDNIRVIPNAVDMTHWKPMDVRDKFKDTFRFGWAVSNSHAEDWLFIKPVLMEFLKRHPDAKFVCIGDASMRIDNVLPKGQVDWHPFSDLWEYHYPLRMAMLGLDVAIAPLADSEFNRCKSPLKYAEYTAFGWPVIAQDMTPYKEHIVHGQTGLLAGTHEEWLAALERLYADKGLRAKLHFNAMYTLKNLFDLQSVAREWQQAYLDCINSNGAVKVNE